MFEYQIRIHMRNTDATGHLFFSDQFTLALEAFEEFLLSIGLHIKKITEGQIGIPIVHAEADYKRPLKLADLLKIQLGIKNLGNSSFSVFYLLCDQSDEEVGRVTIVHVYTDLTTKKPIPLPLKIRTCLEQHLWKEDFLHTALKEKEEV